MPTGYILGKVQKADAGESTMRDREVPVAEMENTCFNDRSEVKQKYRIDGLACQQLWRHNPARFRGDLDKYS